MTRILWNVFKESASWHLLLPLSVSLLIGTGFAWSHGARSATALMSYWLGGPIVELLAIYVTFLVVLVLMVRHQTQVRMANLGVLRDVLPRSKEYFAIGAIPIQEWFDPAVQVYLSTIVAHKHANPAFVHQRVLIFFDESSLEDIHVVFADEYFARCLQAIHAEFQIPLGYLTQTDLYKILDGFDPSYRAELGWYPRRANRLMRGIRRVSDRWFTKDRRLLAFAVVTDFNDQARVIRFTKGRRVLHLAEVAEPNMIKPYIELARRIKSHIYNPGTTEIARQHDFAEQIKL